MQNILQHPIIQELSSEEEENDGFWDGSKCYSFRQAQTDEDGDYLNARIEILTPDGAYYFFTLDSESYVSRYYQPPNQYGQEDISILDLTRWEASDLYFARFKQYLTQKI